MNRKNRSRRWAWALGFSLAMPPRGGMPAPAAEPEAPPAQPVPSPSLAELRAEYETLKDALFRSRARRETLERALFSTRLAAKIIWDGGRHHLLKRLELRLDGIRVWESDKPLTGDDPILLAGRSVPPGAHALAVRMEVRSRDDAKLGYVTEQSFTLALPEGKSTTATITIDEEGSVPSYNPEIEIEIASK